jgi:hypothetical protein
LTCSFAYLDHGGATLGPHFAGRRGGVRPVEPVGEGVQVARVQVAVAVERLGGRAVAQHRLNDLYRGVLSDRQGRRSVPKVMDAEALGEPGRRHRRPEVPLPHLEARSGPPAGIVNTRSSGAWGRSAR